jgi:hypothetical protein
MSLNLIDKISQTAKKPSTSQSTNAELNQMKRMWSKMCRLVGNLSQERNDQKMKYFFSSEFIYSLSRFVDKLQQQSHLQTGDENLSAKSEANQIDLDFYHSLMRFVK